MTITCAAVRKFILSYYTALSGLHCPSGGVTLPIEEYWIVRSLSSFAILLLVAAGGFAQRGGGSHSGSMGTGGHRPGGFGGSYRAPSSSFNRPGYRSGVYGSGFRYNNYPSYSSGFGYYPGFYSGFGYGYGSGYGYGYDSPAVESYYSPGGYGSGPAYYESVPQSPPVVINEYYRPPTAQPRMRDYSNGGYGLEPPPQSTSSAPAKKPDYWLIAFPNGTIVLAVAYWTDHDTLHYVTRAKEPKQIPISAIDRDLTEQLNQERGLEFRIPK